MTAPRILLTCPPMLGLVDEFRPVFAARGLDLDAADITQTMSEAELVKRLPSYDGWIAGDDPASDKVLTAGVGGRLRAFVKWGVGVDNVDFEAAKRLGLNVAHTPGVFGREVADLAMNYVSGLARQSYVIDRDIRANAAWPKPAGISLADKVVALVGFGDIGRQTARRLLAADMSVRVYDPAYQSDPELDVEHSVWPDGVSDADFLVFTCPLNAATQHMFNAALLPQLKPGVRVVNVGRGPLIDEAALLDGLRSGVVHSAALDVFEVEPLAPNSSLRDFDRCIFGSHNGSNTMDAVRRVA